MRKKMVLQLMWLHLLDLKKLLLSSEADIAPKLILETKEFSLMTWMEIL